MYLNSNGLEQDSTDLLSNQNVDAYSIDLLSPEIGNNNKNNTIVAASDCSQKNPSLNHIDLFCSSSQNYKKKENIVNMTSTSVSHINLSSNSNNITNLANMTNSLGKQQLIQQKKITQHQQLQHMLKQKQNEAMSKQLTSPQQHLNNLSKRLVPLIFNFPTEWLNRAAADFKAGVPRGLIDFHLLQPETQHFISVCHYMSLSHL